MNDDSHDLLLGAYSMGILDRHEADAVEEHLATCAACSEELAELTEARDMLAEVPPEAFLEGAPDDGDLILQRTLRSVRVERSAGVAEERPGDAHPGPPRGVRAGRPRRFRPMLLLAAAAAVVVAAAGGVLIGRQQGHPVDPVPVAPPAGARAVTAVNKSIGATMTATVIPAEGWVRVKVQMNGAPVGLDCRIMVLAKDGSAHEAGSWRTSTSGKTPVVDGSALVPPANVAAVEVDTLQGKPLVIAQF